MTTTRTAAEIASAVNATGYRYFGESAKAWIGSTESRIYFGRNFVRLVNGELTNIKAGKVRAGTIGRAAVEACEAACKIESAIA